MPDAPTPDDLAAIRARHVPMGLRCVECTQGWPCDAARLVDRLDAAECRFPTWDGRELVVTARELDAAWRAERAIAASAQAWAAAWKRAATLHRRQAHGAVRFARGEWEHRRTAEDDLAAAERVVAAARDAEPHVVWREAREALRDALAALDDAREGDDAPEL